MSVLINGQLVPPPGVKGGRAMGGKKAFRFADLPDPIPGEIRDTDEIQRMLKEWKLVPYAGTAESSGDALRAFLSSMVYLSPTHGACIASKKRVSFGDMQVVRRVDPDFDLGQDEEVPTPMARMYVDFLKTVDTGGMALKALASALYEDWEETGDQFIEVVISQSMGVNSYAIYRHRPANCKYLATGKGEQRFVAISPIWTDKYLSKNPPSVLPLFPAVEIEEDGTRRTILHRKNGKNEWYGRPPAFSSWIYQYREYQDASYMVKVSNNNFTGQIIIEVEDDNPDATNEEARAEGYTSEADRIHKNFTHEGNDPMTVMYCSRPSGARPMFVHQVNPNTTEDFYSTMDELAERKIIRSHQWSKRLMEAEEASGLSSNVFIDVLKSRLPVIRAIQEDGLALINKALRFITTDAGRVDFADLGLQFKSPFQEILEQTEENEQQQPDNAS